MAETKQEEERLFCDVEIHVGDRTFSAHRGILASKSDYFKTMFTINMKEKYSGTVELSDISPEIFELVLDYIYSGKVQLSEKNVNEVLKAGSLFLLTDLLDIVDDFLCASAGSKTVFALRRACTLYSLSKLQAKVDEYVIENFSFIWNKKDFLEVTVDEMTTYLSSNKIKATEDDLVLALLKWIKADLPNREKSLLPLFSLIRLQHVSLDCLLDTLRKEPLLKDKEFQEFFADAMHYHLRPTGIKKQGYRCSGVQQNDICCLTSNFTFSKVVLEKETFMSKVCDLNDQFYNYAAVVHKGKLLLFGGKYSEHGNQAKTSINSFDGQRWKTEGRMIYARFDATAVSWKEGVFVFGGVSNNTPVCETEWYKNGTCMTCPKIQTNGIICAQSVAVEEAVYVIGGFADVAHKTVQKDVNKFNLHEQKVKQPPLNHGRANFGACVLDTTIYVCGGIFRSIIGGMSQTQFVNSIEFLHVKNSAAWTVVTTGNLMDFGHTSVVMVNNSQMIVLGGRKEELNCFDCETKCWKTSVSLHKTAGNQNQVKICKLGSRKSGSKLLKWKQ